MFKIVGLFITVTLVVFTWWYSSAPAEQQANLPAPVRAVASDAVNGISEFMHFFNSVVGKRLSRGVKRASGEISEIWEEEHVVEPSAVIALNENMSGTDYTARLMPASDFTRSVLTGANFTKAVMSESALDAAQFDGATFNATVMDRLSARGTDFTGARFNDSDMTGTLAQAAIFKNANFSDAIMSSSQFSRADFEGANLTKVYGDRSIFFEANLTRINISSSDFTRANFDKAKIRKAIITDTHLERASFTGTDLSGTDLASVTGLEQAQLDAACGDAQTKLPAGLIIRSCELVPADALVTRN